MFEKFKFSQSQVDKYYRSASRDFKIASASKIPEVIFKFSYDALIKLAIAVCAKNGLRVKSRQGHHVGLLNKLAEFLGEEDADAVGNRMRKERNMDLYNGGILISKKAAEEYRDWLKVIFMKTEKYLYGKQKLL